MLIGSLAANSFHAASDYDLVIFVSNAPQLWYVGVTSIDQRFTDLLFVDGAALPRITALEHSLTARDELTPIVRWLQRGVIHFDRHHALAQAKQHVADEHWIKPASDDDVFGAWFSLNYNLAQTRRMLFASDPLYQATAEIRMALYGYMDVWWGYFTVRKIQESGEKQALRYLQTYDAEFLAIYQQFMLEQDRFRKFQLYEQTAAIVVAPVGGIWEPGTTAMNVPNTLAIWNHLLGIGVDTL